MDNQQFQNQEFETDVFFANTPVKNAAYYRGLAREKLKKCYWVAVLVVLLAGLLGGATTASYNFSSSTDLSSSDINTETIPMEDLSWDSLKQILIDELAPAVGGVEQLKVLLIILGVVVVLALLLSIGLSLFVGSPVALGMQKFFLNVMDEENCNVGVLFSYFKKGIYGKSIALRILHGLLLFLATLPTLVLTVGVVAMAFVLTFVGESTALLLAMMGLALLLIPVSLIAMVVEYQLYFATMILAEYPEMRAIDAIRNSRSLMKGNKWRLFCLHMSFMGWILLAALTCGVGMVFLSPYMFAADAAFYDDLTNRAAARNTEFPSLDPDDYLPENGDEGAQF